MRLALVPRNTDFHDVFADAGRNAVAVARLVQRRFEDYPDTGVAQREVKDLEHEGDRLTAEVFRLLNTQFVTPFDREDIHDLARAIDDVVDHIEHASDLLDLYKVDAPMEQAVMQCSVVVRATESLSAALAALGKLSNAEQHIADVKRLEDEGDRISRDALAALFEDEDVSPRTIIGWKDIFEALEDAVDACDGAAHRIGNIVVKNR